MQSSSPPQFIFIYFCFVFIFYFLIFFSVCFFFISLFLFLFIFSSTIYDKKLQNLGEGFRLKKRAGADVSGRGNRMCKGPRQFRGPRRSDYWGCRPHRASEGHGRSRHGGGDSLLVIYAPGAPKISLGYHLAGEDLSSRV